MKIFFNGNELELSANTTLKQFIEQQGLTGKRLAAEVNLQIIPKAEHDTLVLKNQDKVEIVHAIGGG